MESNNNQKDTRLQQRKVNNGGAAMQQKMLSTYGKLPPQAVDMEEVVLGALLIDKSAILVVVDFLAPDMFYRDEHKLIYEAMLTMFSKRHPIDLLTLSNELRSNGKLDMVGGVFYISDLTSKIMSAANVEYHARIVVQKYIMRSLIYASAEIQELAYDETTDVFDLLDLSQRKMVSIADVKKGRNFTSVWDVARSVAEHVRQIKENPEAMSGITTGWGCIDRIIGSFQGGDLIIIAARPGMGKTGFVIALCRNVTAAGKKIAMFSLEMSSLQLGFRIVADETKISSFALRNGDISEKQLATLLEKCGRLQDLGWHIDDTPALTDLGLRAALRRLIIDNEIHMIVIDYLQLMSGGKGSSRRENREQEISAISRSLKALGKELNIPVVALSQLSRAVEQRGGQKRPQLSDLRESGSIEQDADTVCFIHRPEYYGVTEIGEGMPIPEGLTELIFAKNRHGELDTAFLKFDGRYSSFTEFDDATLAYISNGGDAPVQETKKNYKQKSSGKNETPLFNNDWPPADEDVPF